MWVLLYTMLVAQLTHPSFLQEFAFDRSFGSDHEYGSVDCDNEELEKLEHDSDNEHSSDSDVVITKVESATTSLVKEERPSTRLNDRDTGICEGDDSEDEAVFRENPFKK